MSRFQFIWWGWGYALLSPPVSFWRPDPESGYARLYRWAVTIGPLEIRRWV